MKKLIFAAIFAAFVFIFCSDDKNNPVRLASGQSGADIDITLGEGPLPSKLMVELSAGGQEPRFDTAEVKGRRINCRFLNIAPHKEWKVTAHTVDMNDSTIHFGSTTFTPKPNQMSYIPMELQSKYFSMHALFSRTQGNMTRAEILIDDKYLFTAPISANSSDTAVVDAEYIPLKSQYKIVGKVYGTDNGSDILLFEGNTTVNLPWYDDHTVIFTLNKNPAYNGGPSSMSVWLQPAGGNTGAGRIGQPVYFNGTGHYYDVVTLDRDITWDQARDMAAALSYKGMRGHLVTIRNAAENDFVWQYLAKQSGVSALFIGGYQDPEPNLSDTATRDKNWHWVTGEPWNYTNWSPGEPNNFGGIDEIWLMMWVYSGKWNDQITRLRGFIVEYD
ncbi:MAG: hypothetical protein FWE57_08745 [Chitinispirillia bacterium]|nr:hypothetical protein [Chitinispirillia bacterium]